MLMAPIRVTLEKKVLSRVVPAVEVIPMVSLPEVPSMEAAVLSFEASSKRRRSSPAPATMESAPPPPVMVSLPDPDRIVSAAELPERELSPSPPSR